MCDCGCRAKKSEAEQQDAKTYVCSQCNTFKTVGSSDPAPDCCGKKMSEMD